jgi:Plasmid pRiA4b ORF-3-like protein
MAGKKRAPIFIFNVALKGAKRIWRRIATRGDQTLEDLHFAIFDAFDRDDEHLYAFYLFRPGARGRDKWRGAVEFAHPLSAEDPGPFADHPVHNAAETQIALLPLGPGTSLEYLFDFGDEWWHELTVEQTDATPDKKRYPRVIEKRGDSPPQYPDFDGGE